MEFVRGPHKCNLCKLLFFLCLASGEAWTYDHSENSGDTGTTWYRVGVFIQRIGNILIAPTISGPNAVNTPVSFKMRWLNFAFGVATNAGIQIAVTGANPQNTTVITDANGVATFT